ncbi:helix-turn-helix transcriptional regulator (plasmid) [Rhizobium sp. NIBRBAC000502774]|nr:helix-turn-helix transcriptional regulator [Rhizobium sp. NIBRBAC000502774]
MIDCHSTRKYSTGSLLSVDYNSPGMRVETWHHGHGVLPDVRLGATEIAVMLAGRLTVDRTGDGRRQRAFGLPGMFWLCPAGVYESDITLSDTMDEVIHFFLPPDLLGETALEEYEVDPASIKLDYAGGTFDPMLGQIAVCFRQMRHSPVGPAERLLGDSLRTALAAHLLRNYLTRPEVMSKSERHNGSLDSRRLRRVVDLVESRLGSELSLSDLAREACLSPYHFSRSFHRTLGKTPYQFVLERRIEAAKEKIRRNGKTSLVEIALETGFASQSGFIRAFRKATGQTPSEFRAEKS